MSFQETGVLAVEEEAEAAAGEEVEREEEEVEVEEVDVASLDASERTTAFALLAGLLCVAAREATAAAARSDELRATRVVARSIAKCREREKEREKSV